MMTNRKQHTRFPLVPKSTTLDDLERPLSILFQNKCVFGARHENEMKINVHYQWRRCSAINDFSFFYACMHFVLVHVYMYVSISFSVLCYPCGVIINE